MKINKRLLAALLVLLMTVSMTACSSSSGDQSDGGSSQPAAEDQDSQSGTEDADKEDPEGSGTSDADDLGVPYIEHPILGDGGEAPNSRHAEGYFTMTKGNSVFRIPDYYGEIEGKTGEDNLNAVVTTYYAATGDNLGMIEITAFDASESGLTDFDFVNAYSVILERKDEQMSTLEGVTDLEWGEATLFRLDNGFYAVTRPYTYTYKGTPLKSYITAFNNPVGKSLMYVELTEATGAEYDYIADYEQIVLSATSK